MSESGGFIKKPGKGWLHSDQAVQEGIAYQIKYVGCIGINESMKSLSFEVRTQVARESIRRVAETARLLSLPRRSNRRNDDNVNKILSTNCITQWSGMNVQLHINTQFLKVTQSECNDTLFQHTMQNISFACGGDTDIADFVAYVAKDEANGRACYVFECGADGLANNVITTVGQAFELRFRKFLSSMPNNNSNNNNSNNNSSHSNNSSSNVNGNSKNHLHNHNSHNHHSNNKTSMSPPTTKTTNSTPPVTTENNSNKKFINNSGSTSSSSATAHAATTNSPGGSSVLQNSINNSTKQTNGSSGSSQAQPQQQPKKYNFDEKLEKMHWFHGLLTRDNAEKMLMSDGDYLVRETNKAERQYVLSGKYKGECRHIFLVDPSGVVRTKDRVFDNICHLIQYHQGNNIPIISKENELLLENPIHR